MNRVWLTGHLGEDKIGQLEKEIENLHAEERVDEIERRVAPTLERLKALIRKLGSQVSRAIARRVGGA